MDSPSNCLSLFVDLLSQELNFSLSLPLIFLHIPSDLIETKLCSVLLDLHSVVFQLLILQQGESLLDAVFKLVSFNLGLKEFLLHAFNHVLVAFLIDVLVGKVQLGRFNLLTDLSFF